MISVPALPTYLLARMKIKNLDPTKYKRFFAFGCSFTRYKWATWADIIGQNIPYYENWGRQGVGNHYIFNAVLEADAKHNFGPDDLVIIMWSQLGREDRYFDKRWISQTISELTDSESRKYAIDTRAHLIRDLAYIKSIQTFLEHKKCDYAHLAMYPLVYLTTDLPFAFSAPDMIRTEMLLSAWIDLRVNKHIGKSIEHPDVVESYIDVYTSIEKTILECFSSMYVLKRENNDPHPTPEEFVKYLDKLWPDNKLENKTIPDSLSQAPQRL